MVIRPFSSVFDMLPIGMIGGFKTVFYFLGQRWRKKKKKEKKWSPLIDNSFNDGFWAKISIFFSGPDVESSCFWLKEISYSLESRTLI